MEKVRAVAHITPALGAGFAQYTLHIEAGGTANFSSRGSQHFFYVLQGKVVARARAEDRALSPGEYLYLSPADAGSLRAGEDPAVVAVFAKEFVPQKDEAPPASLFGRGADVEGQPFLGNPKALLQVLLPDAPAWDMAVNVFTYQPGATLPFVETHVMEHGLLMLRGQGIYRLEEEWYPVTAGDVIWMAPHCPQWFVAMGDEPAAYLYYKDVNRPLL